MLPEVLVAAVHRAIERRQRRLTPGFSNRLFALAGRWLPGTVDWIMKKTLCALFAFVVGLRTHLLSRT